MGRTSRDYVKEGWRVSCLVHSVCIVLQQCERENERCDWFVSCFCFSLTNSGLVNDLMALGTYFKCQVSCLFSVCLCDGMCVQNKFPSEHVQ